MKPFENSTKNSGARIPPLPMSDMREDWLQILKKLPGAGLKGENAPVNVFGTLMHNPGTFGPFLDYWITSKLQMGLSVREQELVILRMGYHYQCDYVWKHHVPPLFAARETALLMLTDEMLSHRTIREEAWQEWSGMLSSQEVIDLISLFSQYVFFSLLNNSIRVEIEEPLQKIQGLRTAVINPSHS
jgi:4-carboxymuconolactone decarboxylase